jgi:hypothetical protein
MALLALAIFVALSSAAVLLPARAVALDSDLKHTYAFTVKASHGYRLLAIAASQRLDGKGELVLFVGNRKAGATYVAPATVTGTRIEADLGRLGEVSLDVAPSGRKKELRTCATPREIRFEPPTYRGSFEFHGEEGYTEATSASPADATHFFASEGCRTYGSGETFGAGLPGARIGLNSRVGSLRLHLQAIKNNPGARTRFEVGTREISQGIAISRSTTLWLGSGAFAYDPSLRTASLAPPAPFSGQAEFHRDASRANRWSGNLTVDLPGRSDLPLVGPAVKVLLIHACFLAEEVRGRC